MSAHPNTRLIASRIAIPLLLVALCFLLPCSSAAYSGSATKKHTESPVNALPATKSEHHATFLLCGKDRASGLYDVIMLGQLYEDTHCATLVQIPRDTYAAYTEGSYKKLNGAPAALGGIGAFRDFLSLHLGIPIDHYIAVDLDSVGDMVDAIGGVTLDVPTDMDYEDHSQNLSIHLKAGRQTLDGDMAEQFLRFRSGYVRADLDRLDAQKCFLTAFLDQLRAHNTLPDLIRIVSALYGRIKTDLTLRECVRFTALGIKTDPSRLSMETLPGEAARTGGDSGAWYYILSRDRARETLSRLLLTDKGGMKEDNFDPLHRFAGTGYPHFERIYFGAGRS